MQTLYRFFKDETGATAIEYGLIAALVSVVIIAAVATLGRQSAPPRSIASATCLRDRRSLLSSHCTDRLPASHVMALRGVDR